MSKLRIFLIFLLGTVTVFLFWLCFYFTGNALNQMPRVTQMNYNLNSGSASLTISDMQRLSERISMKLVSFCSELGETYIKEEAVTPVLTNENYFEIYEAEINGSGITEEFIKNNERVAVIGSRLAVKLFFNTDVVGKTIEINNNKYKICGVFKESEDFINQVSSDGKHRIYIPYTCYDGYENCELNTIAYSNKSSSAPLIEQMNLVSYHSTNFSEKSKVIENFKHIIFLILFAALCIIALRIWYRLCKRLCSDIRDDFKKHYFWQSVKAEPLKFILLILTGLGIPAVLLTLFFISDFSIYIISKYIPYDNMFDISHYLNAIIENSNMLNSLALTGDTCLLNVYNNTFDIMLWLVIVFLLMFVVFVYILIQKMGNVKFIKEKL